MPDNRRNNRTRAHYIHRLSYSAQEKLAGSFVLIAIGLLVWLLLTSQKTQNLFEDEITLYGTMSSIQAVNEDTDVIISGLNVGHVSEVNIDDTNHVVVSMMILKKYQKLIRKDSIAELLNFKFALLGKSVIEISIGSPRLPIIENGDTLPIKESLNLVKLVAKFEPVLGALQDSIKRMNEILQEIDPGQVGTNISNLSSISNNLKDITEQIRQGKGFAGNAIYDDGMQQEMTGTISNLKDITDQIQQGHGAAGSSIYDKQMQQDISSSVSNLKLITEQTRTLLESIQQQVDELPELTDKVKPLLEEADKTIKATQQIWPLSSSMPKDTKQSLSSPEASE
ncbi:MAG TPA: MCE family protein [Gammaproteobacteria bacterium]|nr:MCE family protein [Gammaproteobacteria bacterium]